MENLPKDIKTYIKNNEIFVSGLKSGIKYFTNMIITNPISGELITLTPTILILNKVKYSWNYLIIAILVIIILAFAVYYYSNKYINSKLVLNYEQNDIRNMESFPYEENIRNISESSKKTTEYINLEESQI